MIYNSEINHRRSIRLKGYDYSSEGLYFVTICTHNRELFFEKYPILKDIVIVQWNAISQRFSNVILDEYIIMPNHFHGIIELTKGSDTSLGHIIGAFKSLCVTNWLTYIKENHINAIGKIWQRNYFERIIRSHEELINTREYIKNNLMNWKNDKENIM